MSERLRNQSGAAVLMAVLFGIAILASIAFSFYVDTKQKQSGAALDFTSVNAFMVAEAGVRYAEKCVKPSGSPDSNCPCAGTSTCTTWQSSTTAVPASFSSKSFANARGSFSVAFSNVSTDTTKCATSYKCLQVTSTGTFDGGAVRKVTKILLNNPQTISTCNAQKAAYTTAATTVTLAYTVPSDCGTNLMLVVAASGEDDNKNDLIFQDTSAVFGSTTMSRAASIKVNIGGDDDLGVGMFYLSVSAGQSGTITVTYSGTVSTRMIHAIILNNTLSTGPESQVTKDTNSGDTTDTIETHSNNSLVVSAYVAGSAVTPTPVGTAGSNSHTLLDSQTTGGTLAGSGLGYLQVATTSTITGVGYTSGSAPNMAQVLAAFAPAP